MSDISPVIPPVESSNTAPIIEETPQSSEPAAATPIEQSTEPAATTPVVESAITPIIEPITMPVVEPVMPLTEPANVPVETPTNDISPVYIPTPVVQPTVTNEVNVVEDIDEAAQRLMDKFSVSDRALSELNELAKDVENSAHDQERVQRLVTYIGNLGRTLRGLYSLQVEMNNFYGQ